MSNAYNGYALESLPPSSENGARSQMSFLNLGSSASFLTSSFTF
jgi:hypothetical protein